MIAVLSGFGKVPLYDEAASNGHDWDVYRPGPGSPKPITPPVPSPPVPPPPPKQDAVVKQIDPKKEIDFVKYGMIAGGVAVIIFGIYAAYKYKNKLKLDKVFNGHFSRTRRNKK